MSSRRAGPRLRRTWPQRLLISFNACCVVAALVTAGALGYANKKAGEIPRVRLGDSLTASGKLKNGQPQNYLIVGVDSDAGLGPDSIASHGRQSVSGLRSDTIMVLHIDPAHGQASILSFPRDLWVDVPNAGSSKINAAIEIGSEQDPNGGGPKLLIDTLKQNFQVGISHYVQINFAGFESMVDALGGISVYFDTPVRDRNSGLAVDTGTPGCIPLNGEQALAFARSRHYQALRNGRWVSDPLSDLSRIQRQQLFVRKVITKAISEGIRNPLKLKSFVEVGVKNVTLDDTLTLDDLVSVGERFKSFNPDTLKTYTPDVIDVVHEGQEALDLKPNDPYNTQLLNYFQGNSTDATGSGIDSSLTAGVVRVQVSNGSGVANQATRVTRALQDAGFQTDAPAIDASTDHTVVLYPAGQQAQAQLVARYLDGPVELRATNFVTVVTVNTGPDFTTVRSSPKPASAVPTSGTPGSSTPASTTTTTTTPPAPVDLTPTTINPFVPQTPIGQTCG
ncbi:MAG TPA: LCP family protein [Acidimicrobiales bacterium]